MSVYAPKPSKYKLGRQEITDIVTSAVKWIEDAKTRTQLLTDEQSDTSLAQLKQIIADSDEIIQIIKVNPKLVNRLLTNMRILKIISNDDIHTISLSLIHI